MSLTEKSRSSLYQGLRKVIDDEEAVGEMLSHFPAREVDEPVTRDQLRAELSLHDQKVDARFNAIDARFNAIDARFEGTDGQLTGIDQRFDLLQAHLEKHLSDEMRRWYVWTVTSLTALFVLVLAAARVVGAGMG